ncbi:centromere protein O [Camelus ferus]|uniref:Centromere protein O n=2 Tax=Camelus TaxID=9836 RepID=A0A8B8UG17_CAMFR|nr:centromere protein O [Camelus ferus]XP_045367819.1 centromere protein O [Camelus bactrianus]
MPGQLHRQAPGNLDMELANAQSQDGESKGGVLAHLERLEIQLSKSHKKLEEPQREQAVESALGTKIHKLRLLRDKLSAEVKQRQARVKVSAANVEPDQTLEISEQEILERKQENVKAILQAYRFTGISGKLTSRGVCVCISTAFEGNLLDSYFVDLVIQKPLRIHHHSIPVFIPLEEIAAKYLQTNIQHFLFILCEYLNAYSGRKYQADRLQSDFAACLAGPLQRNSLCNLLSFTYKVEPKDQSFPFCARLLYKDLTTALPTDVTVTYRGTDASATTWEEQRAAHEHMFFTKPLHQVFTSFARKGEKLDMSLVS